MDWSCVPADARALDAAQMAEKLADWKPRSRVGQTAKRASARATEEFCRLRIEYHHKAKGLK